MANVIPMPPTTQERYRHLRDNAEAFVESMNAMVAAAERDGDDKLASQLKVWALMPWQAALRDDDSGDLWWTCDACGILVTCPDGYVFSPDQQGTPSKK